MPLHQQNFPGTLSTVAIFGPGLMGGSLALALRQRQPDWTLRPWARSTAVVEGLKSRFPDATEDAATAARGADFCVFCTPVGAMPGLARQIQPHLGPDCVVTDAGSTKARLVAELESLLEGHFIGAHPMAGSEQSGFAAAREDLFEGAVTVLTPTPRTPAKVLTAARRFWAATGSRLAELAPASHDRIIARVSHLPHVVAAALVNALSTHPAEELNLAGGGFRDTTRIAAGPPAMWREIILENQEAVLSSLDDLQSALDELRSLIRSGNSSGLEACLSRAKTTRELLP